MSQALEIWNTALNIIKEEVSEIGFNTWIRTIEPVKIKSNFFYIKVPIDFNKGIIESKYQNLITNAVAIASGKEYDIKILLPSENEDYSSSDRTNESIYLNKRYTFHNFVVGESNRLAHAAALSVSEEPGLSYNPLFLYGGVGLGKTHLMNAIGNYINETTPTTNIMYVSCEKFTNEFINAIRDNSPQKFKDKYRNVDILMVDDIQFLSGKESVQEEFFHTFNHLYQFNKQIILTSDRVPRDIPTLEERLRSRFEMGLICDVKPPELETRIAILKKKFQNENIYVSESVIDHIAAKIKSNIRELEGALNRIIALSVLTKKEISKELTDEVIKDLSSSDPNKNLGIETIILEVANFYSIDPLLLKSKKKTAEISFKRQIAMYIIRTLTDISLPKIGTEFNRDHSTVMHSVSKIENDIVNNPSLKFEIDEIIKNITGI